MIGKHYLEQFTKIQTDTEMSSSLDIETPVVEGDLLLCDMLSIRRDSRYTCKHSMKQRQILKVLFHGK